MAQSGYWTTLVGIPRDVVIPVQKQVRRSPVFQQLGAEVDHFRRAPRLTIMDRVTR